MVARVGRDITVLIVEDETDNREIMRAVVEDILGYSALLASDGMEALQLLQDAKPNVILMDLMMPVMDGFEATRRLKAAEETRHIPIVAVTALSRPSDHERAIGHGADDYVSKPFDIDTLVAVINRYTQPCVMGYGGVEERSAGA